MVKELSNKIIYDDFKAKVILTDDEAMILDMLLKKDSIVKISQNLCMSDRNVSRIIREIKNKYNDYRKVEIAKLGLFNTQKLQ